MPRRADAAPKAGASQLAAPSLSYEQMAGQSRKRAGEPVRDPYAQKAAADAEMKALEASRRRQPSRP